MIPQNKFDKNAISDLRHASDEDVLKNVDELLEWLKDCNWPVFDGVVCRLSSLGSKISTPLTKILLGSDSIWKANIIGHLIPKFTQESQAIYTQVLTELLSNPSENDFEEGVVDFIEIQLARNEKST